MEYGLTGALAMHTPMYRRSNSRPDLGFHGSWDSHIYESSTGHSFNICLSLSVLQGGHDLSGHSRGFGIFRDLRSTLAANLKRSALRPLDVPLVIGEILGRVEKSKMDQRSESRSQHKPRFPFQMASTTIAVDPRDETRDTLYEQQEE